MTREHRGTLVPTFRSSCVIAAPSVTNFGKSWALANLLILVPLYRSEVPDRTRRLRCRDFRSAILASNQPREPQRMPNPLQIGIVVFPKVTQLDFTGPLQVGASGPD